MCVCVCIAENLVLTCSFSSVLRIIILNARCCKWGIMRFDDPEPTQLLNGYTPHLDRKCCLNCQMRQFLSPSLCVVFPFVTATTAIMSPHARRKSPSRWYHRKIFNFMLGIFWATFFRWSFFHWLKRKFYIFKKWQLVFCAFSFPSSFDHIELCVPQQQMRSVRFWKLT